MYLTKDCYVEYVKNFYNSVILKINIKKQANDLNRHFTNKIFKLPINTQKDVQH